MFLPNFVAGFIKRLDIWDLNFLKSFALSSDLFTQFADCLFELFI